MRNTAATVVRRTRMAWGAVALVAAVGAARGDEATSAEALAADQAFFESRIRPLLHDHCLECHAGGAEGGLRLDSLAALLAGGDSGPAAVPGQPDGSLLLKAVHYGDPALQMPPAGRFARNAITQTECEILHALPETIDMGDILACHGTPTDDMAYLLEEPAEGRLAPAPRALLTERLGSAAARKVILCGHSHRQATVTGPGGVLILNPGSVGCPAFADVPAASNFEHRSPHARYAILTERNGRWGTEMIALEYDWNAAAQKAADLGWPKWATMLATGATP